MRAPRRSVAVIAAAALAGAAGGGIVVAIAGTGGGNGTTTAVTEIAPASGPSKTATSSSGVLTPQQIYAHAKDSVAFVTATSPSSGGGLGGGSSQATGSGFVVSSNGDVVTNAHVVSGANKVTVKIGDGKTQSASIAGQDQSTDIALLKVSGGNSASPLAFGDSATVQVGDPTYAIGNPFGLSRTLTTGVVSALQRQIQAPDGFSINNVIQTDAALNPGNSGGPLLDAHGNVIGVNSQIASSSALGGQAGNVGIGFAVPSNTVRSVVQQLEQGQTVAHAYLGVVSSDAPGGGARVNSVVGKGPAQQAGIRANDVITSFGGKQVGDAAGLSSLVGEHHPGDKVQVTVRRGNATEQVTVTLGTQPKRSGNAQPFG